MPYFPQLVTGGLVQYPVRMAWSHRAVVNEALDGTRITSADSGAVETVWDLEYHALSASEAEGLKTLFTTCEGRLGTFVFADPFGNLLARSEQFNQSPWQADPLIAWAANAADPLGGTRAMQAQNNGAIPQKVRQSVDLPGNFEFAFSAWIRSAAGAAVMLRAARGSATQDSQFLATPEWRRVELSVSLGAPEAGVEFAIELASGAAVELFGAQVDAQRHASGYKRTLDRSGLHPEAHFAQDELQIVADTYQSFATRLRVLCTR